MVEDFLTLVGWVVVAVVWVVAVAVVGAGSYWLTSQALRMVGV